MHPICIGFSIFASLLFALKLSGVKMIKFYLSFVLPTAIFAAILNPLFNHEGVTVIAYFPNGTPLTKESLLYGFAASGMLASVMSWFYCFNIIITSDKIIYLFSKITPTLSLLVSMILRFIPNFKNQINEISMAQKSMGIYNQNKFRALLSVLSSEITLALESSVITADSMKSRGYGSGKRTFYSCYQFNKIDIISLIMVAIFGFFVISLWIQNKFSVNFYPMIFVANINVLDISLYGIFCFMPIILECVEEMRWNLLKSKI